MYSLLWLRPINLTKRLSLFLYAKFTTLQLLWLFVSDIPCCTFCWHLIHKLLIIFHFLPQSLLILTKVPYCLKHACRCLLCLLPQLLACGYVLARAACVSTWLPTLNCSCMIVHCVQRSLLYQSNDALSVDEQIFYRLSQFFRLSGPFAIAHMYTDTY